MNKELLYSQTYTGKKFYYFDAKLDQIDIIDIAHALANQCRFNGHCHPFYSVAEHCYHASYLVPPEDALEALLHDASEAYIGDIPKPLKMGISDIIHPIEDGILDLVFEKFELGKTTPLSDSVKAVDFEMLYWEKQALMVDSHTWGCFEDVSFPENQKLDLPCWSPETAKVKFLERFEELAVQ